MPSIPSTPGVIKASELALQEQVKSSLADKTPLAIQGGNSKAFYGNPVNAERLLDVSSHSGIVEYAPCELCLTVCAGTRIVDIDAALAENQQMLPFEPPVYNENATIGGAIAAGLSGPRRAYSGSVRDAVLGVKIINGKGEIISFGGQVMKNVAGYDVTRLMTGSFGTLGVILEVSLKVLPKPALEATLIQPFSHEDSIQHFTSLRKTGLPISASCYYDNQVYLRLSGSEAYISDLYKKKGWGTPSENNNFWQSIRNHTHDFFQQTNKPLWRLSVASVSPASAQLGADSLIEWGGSLRWAAKNTPTNIVKSIAEKKSGHAVLFRGNIPEVQTFPKPEPALFMLHQKLKRKLDPQGIFNPDRLYLGL